MRLLHGFAVLLQVIEKRAQVVGRKILAGDDHGRRMSREADRLEIARRVVFHVRRQHRRRDMRAHAAGEQGVAVRRGAGDAGRADRAAGAADILDHQGLAEHLAHLLGDDARHHITRAARRERNYNRNGSGRISLRMRSSRNAA